MEKPYHLVHVTIYKFGGAYQVDLSTNNPSSEVLRRTVRRLVRFDVEALLEQESLPVEYGRLLAQQLFADEELKLEFLEAEDAANDAESYQRFSLCIDTSAQELQTLRWELLRHPKTNALFSTSERVLFSRFIVSSHDASIRAQARPELTALIAISAPPREDMEKQKLALVDFEGEMSRIKRALGEVRTVRTLGGPGSPCTLTRLLEALRGGVDIVYLVSHGSFGPKTETPILFLQNDDGHVKQVNVEEIATAVSGLQTRPRLMVLASCQSAGDGKQAMGTTGGTSVQATLAARLANVGVPALIAMQGLISMKTVEQMMPVFFEELFRDGQIDRAMSAARGSVRARDDAWMPALFMRLKTGKLWHMYTPGFRTNGANEVWERLLDPISEARVLPILGPRLLASIYEDSHEVAHALAEDSKFPFPLHEWEDLPRVTQYLSVRQSRANVLSKLKKKLISKIEKKHKSLLPAEPDKNLDELYVDSGKKLDKLLTLVGAHLRQSNPVDAYNVLAELPASMYVTTNFDTLLEQALVEHDKTPHQVVTRWRDKERPLHSLEDAAKHTNKTPMVYHPYGAFDSEDPDNDKDLVLTEDDYFDYLIKASEDTKLIPMEVQSALLNNSLLFLGFRLTDWHFRVFFRLMMSLQGKKSLKDYCHVAVQLDPDLHTMADIDHGKKYLEDYFGEEANIQIYWGSAEDFLKELHHQLPTKTAAPVPEKNKLSATNPNDDEFYG